MYFVICGYIYELPSYQNWNILKIHVENLAVWQVTLKSIKFNIFHTQNLLRTFITEKCS